jgi:hypothetical protein
MFTRDNDKSDIATIPCYWGGCITRLLDSLADSLGRWCAVLMCQSQYDVAVLIEVSIYHQGQSFAMPSIVKEKAHLVCAFHLAPKHAPI